MNVNQIKTLVAKGKIDQALSEFSHITVNTSHENPFVLLQSRYSSLVLRLERGIISTEEFDVFKNRIIVSFLHIIDDLNKSNIENEKVIVFLYFENINVKINLTDIRNSLSNILQIELNEFEINIDFGEKILELILPIKEAILLFGLYRIVKKTIKTDTVHIVDIRLPLIEKELIEKQMLQFIFNLEKELAKKQVSVNESVKSILEDMPTGDKMLILMYLHDEMSIAEIAEIIDKSQINVRKRIQRNIVTLKSKIDKYIRKNNLELYFILENFKI